MDKIAALTDEHLVSMVDRFAASERAAMPEFLACLGELDRRKLAEKRGYSSTFDYCLRRLGLSEDEAGRRIQAARAAVVRPELLSAMAENRLTLTGVSRLAPHVRRPDAPEIIAHAEGKSSRELEKMLAPLNPVPVKHDTVRTVAVSHNGALVEEKAEFSFQGPPALDRVIDRIKELLAHRFPSGALGDVLLVVARFYLEKNDPQEALRLGRTVPVKGNAAIPAAVRRAVWARDGGRCIFVGSEGVRCGTRRMLELDHKNPRALGGEDSVANLRLLCRSHNDAERRRILGEGKLSTNTSRDVFVDNSLLQLGLTAGD